MKPILILDFEYKHYGERLCGKCIHPVFFKDDYGYIKYYEHCPKCGTLVEVYTEGDKIQYAQKNQLGYIVFDEKKKAELEKRLENERKIGIIARAYTELETAIYRSKDLSPSQLKRLAGAKETIREVLKELENAPEV